MTALYTSPGGGVDRPWVDLERSPAVSRAAVATASRGVSKKEEGTSMGRRPEAATYVHTAGCEGVTSGERVAGRPCEPSRLCLFVTVTVDGEACGIYPQGTGTRPASAKGAISPLSASSPLGAPPPPKAASDVGGAPAGVRGAHTRAAQQPQGGGHSRFPAPARREVLAPRRTQ